MKKTMMSLVFDMYDRRIHEGALRYGVESKTDIDLWEFSIKFPDPDWKSWFTRHPWRHGLLLMTRLSEHLPLLRRSLRQIRCPIVLLCSHGANTRYPQVLQDDYQAGRLAADYFLKLKFRRFAFVAQNMDAGYAERLRGFQEALAPHNAPLRVIVLQEDRRHTPDLQWGEHLRQYLREAKKPLAVFAVDDMIGHSVLRHSVAANIRVPEQVAVLGLGNNSMICDYTDPPLSSIDTNGEQVGWMAAKLLHGLLRSGKPPKTPLIIPPLGVVERRSTEIVCSENLTAMRIMRYILDHVREQVLPDDIARWAGLSRWNLDRLFVKCYGRTVKQEQTRVRMLRIRELLATTEMRGKEIAQAVGFRTAEHMYRVFLQENKMTMKQYCKKIWVRTAEPWARSSATTIRLVR